MKQKAKYIGPNGDIKYVQGAVYCIKVEIHKNLIIVYAPKMPKKGYTCFSLFLREWDFNVSENCDNCRSRANQCACEWVLP